MYLEIEVTNGVVSLSGKNFPNLGINYAEVNIGIDVTSSYKYVFFQFFGDQ